MKTVIFLLSIFSPFILKAETYDYTNASGDGLWNTNLNWSPNGVPGASDIVNINSGSVRVTTDASINNLNLTNGIIWCEAKLTVNGNFDWSDGDIYGPDTFFLSSSSTTNINGTQHKLIKNNATLENEGYIIWTGDGEIKMYQESLLINQASGTFEIQNTTRLDFVQESDGGYLENYGTIIKTLDPGNSTYSFGQTQIDPVLINAGTISVSAGTLQIERGNTVTASTGIFNAETGSTMRFVDRLFILDGANFTGGGEIEITNDGGTYRPMLSCVGADVTISSNTTLRLNVPDITETTGIITGTAPMVINGTFIWERGGLTGSGGFIANGNTFISASSDSIKLDGTTLTLNGSTNYSSSRTLNFANDAILVNGANAVFEKTTAAEFSYVTGATSTFQNDGTFIFNNNSIMNMEVNLINNDSLVIKQSGTITFSNSSQTNNSSGIIMGTGEITPYGSFTNLGTFSPGESAGTLTFNGSIAQTSSSDINIEIGGLTSGTEFDVITYNGTMTVDGTLNVSLINGFLPQEGDEFNIITYTDHSGTFATVNVPMQAGSPLFNFEYLSNGITLTTNFDASLPVGLSSFRATGGNQEIILDWSTESELENWGFEIYRADMETGPYIKIADFRTDSALVGLGNSSIHKDYRFSDTSVKSGKRYWYQLADLSYSGLREYHGKVSALVSENTSLANNFSISQNYPNPFNPNTKIGFQLPQQGKITVNIYNVLGKRVEQFNLGKKEAGYHDIKWDASVYASGIYFYEVVYITETGKKYSDQKRMVLTK